MKEIKKIAVLGAGTMGTDIAQHFIQKGFEVSLYSRTKKTIKSSLDKLRENLLLLNELELLEESENEILLSKIKTYTAIKDAVSDADLVIETVTENRDIKISVFEEVDRYAPEGAYLCSDTSALNIYDFIKTDRTDRLLITHFFNPASVMPLVEIVRGPETPDETVAFIKAFLESTGKSPIVLKECIPGFVANRLTLALAREAYYLAGEGYISTEDIDKVIISTFGPRYVFEGIFDLYDQIGIDVGHFVAEGLLPELCSSTEVPRLMHEKYIKGEWGVKTGKGFKDYSNKTPKEIAKERNRKVLKSFKYIKEL